MAKKIIINRRKCCFRDGRCASCACGGACFGCAEVCLAKAITRAEFVEIDFRKCTNCGACITACKHGALSFSN